MVERLTPRLRLVAGTLEIAVAEMEDVAALASLLRADVPPEWPPATLQDALPFFRGLYVAHPHWTGWLGWYAVRTRASARGVLCGSVGFKGPPDDRGVVEIGYSVLPDYHGQGLASEMVGGLVAWACPQNGVRWIEAETTPDNPASIRVLERNRFHSVGAGLEPGTIRYRLDPRTDPDEDT